MTERESQKLARRLEREAPHLRVTGTRIYEAEGLHQRYYALDVQDTVEGGSFVVNSVEDWERRRRLQGE